MEARTDTREDGERGRVNTREVDVDVRAERRREVTKSGSMWSSCRGKSGNLDGQWGT